MSDPLRSRVCKISVALPHRLHGAVLMAAQRYGNTLDSYCATAILRQALDDQVIKPGELGFLFSED